MTNATRHLVIALSLVAAPLFAQELPGDPGPPYQAADFVKERNKGGVVHVEGHTDAKGADAYDQKQSLRRADSVKRWFTEHGDDPEGRQKNRRVEIVIKK